MRLVSRSLALVLVIGLGSAVPLASQGGGGSPITFDENMFGGGNFQAGKFMRATL